MSETLNELLEQDGPITQEQLTPDVIRRIREELSTLTETERETKLRELLLKANSEAQDDLQDFRDNMIENTSSLEQHEDNFSKAELKRIVESVIRDTPTTQGDANLFRLQKYFGQIHQPGIDIDGVSGSQTIGFMTTHILATQIFLRELGAKRIDGVRVIPTDGVLDVDTQKAIKEYFGVEVIIPEISNTPIITRENISDSEKKRLGQEVIGKPLTTIKITAYQTEHNIGIDGLIGTETYKEMLATRILTKLGNTSGSIEIIPVSTQTEIINVFKNSNLLGKDISGLRILLEEFRENRKTDSDFESKYGEMYEEIQILNEEFVVSPSGVAAAELAEANSDSFYTMAKEGRWADIAKDPTLLLTGAILFLFGIIGGDTKYTDSFMKRIGWLLGGTILGPKLWNALGGDEVLDDLTNFVRSPAAQSSFEQGQEGIVNFFKTTLPDFFNTSGGQIGASFSTFIGSMETINEKNKDTPKYIENITEVGSIISADEAFLNSSKEVLIDVKDLTSLSGVMSDAAFQKVKALGMIDAEVKAYIEEYILPRFSDDHTFFYETFMVRRATEAAQEVALNAGASIIKNNPTLDSIVRNHLSNLINSGSDIQNRAATKLAIAIQSGDLSNFNLEEFRELSVNEEGELGTIIRKVEVIFEQESYITEEIEKINAIIVATGGFPDTNETISKKIQDLEAIHSNFQLNSSDILAVGLTESDFNINIFENAYIVKRGTLINEAHELGVTTITVTGGTNIDVTGEVATTTLAATQAEERVREEVEIASLESIITRIGEVPTTTATPIDFRTYYETRSTHFTQLEKIKDDNASAAAGTHEAILYTRASDALKKKGKLKDNYLIARARYIQDIDNLNTEIASIATTNIDGDAYQTAKIRLQEISQGFRKISSEVIEGITFDATFDAFLDYVNGTPSFEPEKNSITFLDSEFEDPSVTVAPIDLVTTPTNIQEKISDIESAFDVEVTLPSDVVSDPNAIVIFINGLVERKNLVDTFTSESVQEGKYTKIAEQFKALQDLYILAIEAQTNITEVEKIVTSYQNHLAGKIDSGFWSSSWDAVKSIFVEQDLIEIAFEDMKEKLKIEEFLSQDAEYVFINHRDIFDAYDIFVTKWKIIPEMEQILLNDVNEYLKNPGKSLKSFLLRLSIYTTISSVTIGTGATQQNISLSQGFRDDAQVALNEMNQKITTIINN